MIRKDYVLLAAALKAAKPQPDKVEATMQWMIDVDHIADTLQKDNPALKPSMFKRAVFANKEMV